MGFYRFAPSDGASLQNDNLSSLEPLAPEPRPERSEGSKCGESPLLKYNIPMLFIIGTSIGNIEDTTLRAVRTLCSAEIILAEDTRTFGTYYKRVKELFKLSSKKQQKFLSFHTENEFEQLSQALELLKAGLDVVPHRINKTLEILAKELPNTKIAICREMTKKFEEVVRGTPGELSGKTYKGELTVVIRL